MKYLFSLYLNRLLLISLLMLACAGDVMATLGQAPSATVSTGSAASQGSLSRKLALAPAVPSNLYTLSESQLETGTTLREYATPAGVVFAVVWRGPVLPDLNAVLGGYFNAFKVGVEQARASGRRGAPANVQRDGLVLKSSGRMRNFSGYAYAPDLIPSGVSINDVLQ